MTELDEHFIFNELAFYAIPIALLIYGLVAIIVTIQRYMAPLYGMPALETPKDAKYFYGKSFLQWANLVLGVLMSLNFLVVILTYLPEIIAIPSVIPSSLTLISFFSLLVVTPWFIAFNIPLVWNKRIAILEKASWKTKTPMMLTHKAILWTTWGLGYFVAVGIIFLLIAFG